MTVMCGLTQAHGVEVAMQREAPSKLFRNYEDLFLALSQSVTVLGPKSGPMSR